MSLNQPSKVFNNFYILNILDESIKQIIENLYIFKDYNKELNVILKTNDDKVYCDGNNAKGMLGFGHENILTDDYILNEDLSGKKLIDFYNTYYHVCARNENDQFYCWGNNIDGILGNGEDNIVTYKPDLNRYLVNEKVVDICCGNGHTLVLTVNGHVYAWGKNHRGQIGDDTTDNVHIPLKLRGFNDEKIKAIACGLHHSMVVTVNGNLYSWGRNDYGQLGLERSELLINKPSQICIEAKFDKITCGAYHSLMLSNEGEIYACGSNDWGELGLGIYDVGSTFPIKLKHRELFIEIQAYNRFSTSVSLTKNGSIYVWGDCKGKIINEPIESDFMCFEDLFAEFHEITIKAVNYLPHILNSNYPIGKYNRFWEEIKEIGSGSYGSVYVVKNIIDDTIYAMKKIPIKDDTSIKELMLCQNILEFDSLRLVKYYDFWCENVFSLENGFRKYTNYYLIYIQMDLCDKNLSKLELEVIKDINLYTYNKRLLTQLGYFIMSEIFIEIVEGVNYLHSKDIIHRDLKPDNILIKIDKNVVYVKIGDFGLAKLHETGKKHTGDRGSLEYAAPEQLNRSNEPGFLVKYDSKADIYSLGVIFKEIFHIDVNIDYPITENDILLMNKYKQAVNLYEKMTVERYRLRPDCEIIIKEYKNWAIGKSELNIQQELNILSNIPDTFKSYTQKIIYLKLSKIE